MVRSFHEARPGSAWDEWRQVGAAYEGADIEHGAALFAGLPSAPTPRERLAMAPRAGAMYAAFIEGAKARRQSSAPMTKDTESGR